MDPKVSGYLGIEVPSSFFHNERYLVRQLQTSASDQTENYRQVLDLLQEVLNNPSFLASPTELQNEILTNFGLVNHHWQLDYAAPYVLAADAILRQSLFYPNIIQPGADYHYLDNLQLSPLGDLLFEQFLQNNVFDDFLGHPASLRSLYWYLTWKGHIDIKTPSAGFLTIQPTMLEKLLTYGALPALVEGITHATWRGGYKQQLYQRLYELTQDDRLQQMAQKQLFLDQLAKGQYNELTHDPETQLPRPLHISDKQSIEFYSDYVLYRHTEARETVLALKGPDHNGIFKTSAEDSMALLASGYNVLMIDDRYTPGLTLEKIREAVRHSGHSKAIDKIFIYMHGNSAYAFLSKDTSLALAPQSFANARDLLSLLVGELREDNAPLSIGLLSCRGQLSHNHVAKVLPPGSTFISMSEIHNFAGQNYMIDGTRGGYIYQGFSGTFDLMRLVARAEQMLPHIQKWDAASLTITQIGQCASRPIITMHKDEFTKVFEALDYQQIQDEVTDYICFGSRSCIAEVQKRLKALAPVLTQEEYPLLSIRAAEGKLPHGQDIALAMYQLYGPCNATSLHLIAEPDQVYTQTPNPLLMAMEPAIQWGMYALSYIPGIEAVPDMLGW